MNSFLRRGWNWLLFSLAMVAVVAVGRICWGGDATPTELGAMAAGTQGSLGGNPGLSDGNSVGVGAAGGVGVGAAGGIFLGVVDAPFAPGATADPALGILSAVLGALLGKYGWAVAFLSWMSSLRLVFKTVTTQVEKIVKESPSAKDDQILAEVEASRGWKLFCWLIDLLASIKIGTQFTARAQGASDPRNDGYVPSAPAGPAKAGTPYPVIAALFFTLAFLSGCAVLDKAGSLVSRPVVSERVVTNVVNLVTTNFVPVAVRVPGETVMVTNLVERVVTNVVEKLVTVTTTNFVEKAGIETGLAVAKAGASLAPPPYNAIAAGVLAVISGGLGFLVKRKNDQVNAANQSIDALTGQNDSQAKQLQAVVKGVEQITTAIDPAAGEKVKGIIADASKALGVSDDLHAMVKALTVAPAANPTEMAKVVPLES